MTSTCESFMTATDSRRLLAGLAGDGSAVSLNDHLAHYGPPPYRGRPRRWTRRSDRGPGEGLVGTVERAGLLGRGGAGFPTALKLQAVLAQGRTAVAVANGTEGEPLSRKDRLLMTFVPHLVLDGLSIAAETVGADRAVISAHPDAVAAVRSAVAERAARQLDPVAIEVVAAPGTFVAGEASAVVNWVDRGDDRPLVNPPRPFERGVQRRPTLVQNVETLAHLALIARYGDEWFRSAGTPTDPGTSLVTLSGPVRFPGVHEIERGSSFADLVDRAGGLTDEAQALLVGGYHGVWVPTEGIDGLRLGIEGLAPYGGSIGAGVIAVLGQSHCGLQASATVARYLANQSAGQCGPCVYGLPAIAGALEQEATHAMGEHPDLRRWLSDVEGRGACRHPDGTTRMIKSALVAFSAEARQHAGGSCRAGTRLAPSPALTPAPTARRRVPVRPR